MLFPLAFHQKPHLTAGLFHQLVDACEEAERRATRVILAPIGIGRSSCREQQATSDAETIAAAFADSGFAVEAGSDIMQRTVFMRAVADRARGLSFTRRAIDLPDLLVSAAADAAATDMVYLADGVLAGRHLSRMRVVSPLGRRYVPGDPFAPVPPAAKRPPAGSDPVWATALSLGLTDAIGVDDDTWSGLASRVKERLHDLWNRIQCAHLVRHHGIAAEEPRRVLLSGPPRATASIPLFGSLRVSGETRSLVQACGGLFPFELVIDDLTPRVLYPHYPVTNVKREFHLLASDYGGSAVFLSDLDHDEFDARFKAELRRLTVGDLVKASPPGKAERSRGSYSGYDAVHLAVMGVAMSLRPTTVFAVQAHNSTAVHVLYGGEDGPSVLSRTGPAGRLADHEIRMSPNWLTRPLGVTT
jgi:hypothetical protein